MRILQGARVVPLRVGGWRSLKVWQVRRAGGGVVSAAGVAVLFARSDSIYKSIAGCDVYDIARDARNFGGGVPVVAHPPCRGWGRLRGMAKPRQGEKELGLFGVDMVRTCGGVLEHPAYSSLWGAAGLPFPGGRDAFGGWTLPINQHSFGHRAEKKTFLYVVGVEPSEIPVMPLLLGCASHVIGGTGRRKDGGRLRRGDLGWRPELPKAEREHTPLQLAYWLVDLARLVRGVQS